MGELLKVVAEAEPLFTQTWQSAVDIHLDIGIGIYAAGVIDIDRLILSHESLAIDYLDGRGEVDASHTDFYMVDFAVDIYFFRPRIGVDINIFYLHLLMKG